MIGCLTGGLHVQCPSAAKVFMQWYWTRYAHAFRSPSGMVNEYQLKLGFKATVTVSADVMQVKH